MSKIFDLLHKSKGELADVVLPLVGQQVANPGPAGGGNGSATVEAPSPQVTAAPLSPPSEIRTLNLRVPVPSPLLPFGQGQWRPSEQYRMLRTKIVQHPKAPHLIVVSSPAAGDGKSVTSINTAAALSLKSESQVLLLDGDLRKAAIHRLIGLPESPGLSEFLAGTCSLEDALVRTREFPDLHVMSAGTTHANPVELLDSKRWQAYCAELRERFRYVVIDSPPVGAVADYELIQAACDGVILVVRPDSTNRHLCQRALDLVPRAKFLGVVMNCVPDWAPARHAGADYYYYSEGREYARSSGGSSR